MVNAISRRGAIPSHEVNIRMAMAATYAKEWKNAVLILESTVSERVCLLWKVCTRECAAVTDTEVDNIQIDNIEPCVQSHITQHYTVS